MSEFHELIKNFERIRYYMRQFYIYGFKVRGEYDYKSARTYDNERRRIESWLSEYIHTDYSIKGKQVAISVDSLHISQNPLYAAWRSKSFTDNDLMLHFFLLDRLWDGEEFTAAAICDQIAKQYAVVFDTQTVRLKLKEYETLGLFTVRQSGRKLYYRLSSPSIPEDGILYESLLTAIKFFQEAAPFGFVGSTLLSREDASNDQFSFKHHFIVHTLEDQVLLDTLTAMQQRRKISFTNTSVHSGHTSVMNGIPMKIFVSTRTGRRYVCTYQERSRRFTNIRLDAMSKVELLDICEEYDSLLNSLERNLPHCFGVSFGGTTRMQEIFVKLSINVDREPYVLERLLRERRGGEIQKVDEHVYLYSGKFFDTNEMLGFIRTFTGRILDIQGTNTHDLRKLDMDFDRMYEMYCKER